MPISTCCKVGLSLFFKPSGTHFFEFAADLGETNDLENAQIVRCSSRNSKATIKDDRKCAIPVGNVCSLMTNYDTYSLLDIRRNLRVV